MKPNIIRLETTDSTNRWLRDYEPAPNEPMTVVVANHQTAGRGQGTNRWESNAGENLLFSILIHPHWLSADQQFLLSMAISNAIRRAVQQSLRAAVAIKWPNDIYIVGDDGRGMKLGGILIENRLQGNNIRDCIIGVGINVNQRVFPASLPNPTSMVLADFRSAFRLSFVLNGVLTAFLDILDNWDGAAIAEEYRQHLFWRTGWHNYRDAQGVFRAELTAVSGDGHLLLRDTGGQVRRYAFKEVEYLVV